MMKKENDRSILIYIIILSLHVISSIGINIILIRSNNAFFVKIYNYMIYAMIPLAVGVYYFYKYNKKENYFKTKEKLKFIDFIFYFSFMFVANVSIGVARLIFNKIFNIQNNYFYLGERNRVILILHAVLLAPIVEEMLYRGIILNDLKKYNYRVAIFISSILFGLAHFDIDNILSATIMGFILAYINKKYSLKYSILLHMSLNFIVTIIQYITEHIQIMTYIGYHKMYYRMLSKILIYISIIFILSIIFTIVGLFKKKYNSIFGLLKLDKEDKNSLILFCKNNYLYLIVILIILFINCLFNYKILWWILEKS